MKLILPVIMLSWCATVESVPAPITPHVCPAPSRLSCELLLHPAKTVIYDPRPEFSWECASGGQAYLQSACQIVVRSLAATDTGEIVWDSGRIAGGDSLNVEYQGMPLVAGAKYSWQVRAWDDRQHVSEWSEPQEFVMASTLSESDTSRYQVAEIPHSAVSVGDIDDDIYLIDFGTAAFAYLKLHLAPAESPRRLQVTFGEKLAGSQIDREPGGSIRTYQVETFVRAETAEIEVRPPKDRRNTTGKAIRLPDTVGVVAPFRYVEIRGLGKPPRIDEVVQQRIEYPFDSEAASFESTDATLNAVWEMCKYTIRATTFCGVYVDGDRERIPYEADAYINQLSHYGVDREYALARYSHEYLLKNPTWPTEWKQHSVLMAYADYWYTGDAESLARNYEVLKGDKVLMAAERADGLVDTSNGYRDIVDWPEAERDGYEMLPVNTVVNAFHYATLKQMAYLADVLGHVDDKALFEEKAQIFKTVFNNIFWNRDTARYVDGEGSLHSSLHANLFPLAFGLVPAERRAPVVQFVKSRQMQCSVYAAQYLMEGLYQAGDDSYALELLTSRGKRSWYNMIRSGSTLALEAWDQKFKPNLDWNHAWGAAPANLIPRYLVGVRPAEPGFKKIIVQPRPGNLNSFTARVPTPRGTVSVAFSRQSEAIDVDVSIPGNSTARVGIPLNGIRLPVELIHNGKKTTPSVDGAHAWIDDVQPGKHKFRLGSTPSITRATGEGTFAN